MSQPYVGEIRSFGFNFAPLDWQLCDGSLLSISNFTTLYTLIGTTYGGDGQTTFAVPDLRGRAVVHTGGSNSYQMGQSGGQETVTLAGNQVGIHTHTINAQGGNGSSSSPIGGYLAGSVAGQYAPSSTGVTGAMLAANAGGQAHDNLMPYLCINYCISLYGIFPSQN